MSDPETHSENNNQTPPCGLLLAKVLHSSETLLCRNVPDRPYGKGDPVIVPTRYGNDLAIILGCSCCQGETKKEDIFTIVRLATEEDLKAYDRNEERGREALKICKEKIEVHKLDMKLVSAHYLLEETKVLFFFTAETRVDFRDLVKDLVSVFKMRIELRQIGVRDESRVIGGLAVCGRAYCCHALTDKLKPVSIKMAKEQNLSLNSMKISGPCGRLLCCLAYEYDFYHEEKQRLPSEGNRIYLNDESYKVIEVNILTKRLYLSAQDGRTIDVPFRMLEKNDQNGRWEISPELLESY